MSKATLTGLILFMALQGCATTHQSVLLGATTGAAVGVGIGAAAGQPTYNSLGGGIIGGLSGAIFGGLMGFLSHSKQQPKTNADQPYSKAPQLTKPVVRRVWISDRVEGERLIKGHWVYILEKNSGWRNDETRSEESKEDLEGKNSSEPGESAKD